jgi:hypothetical protein
MDFDADMELADEMSDSMMADEMVEFSPDDLVALKIKRAD